MNNLIFDITLQNVNAEVLFVCVLCFSSWKSSSERWNVLSLRKSTEQCDFQFPISKLKVHARTVCSGAVERNDIESRLRDGLQNLKHIVNILNKSAKKVGNTSHSWPTYSFSTLKLLYICSMQNTAWKKTKNPRNEEISKILLGKK